MIRKDLIGRESMPVRVRIEADAVRKFAETIGIEFNHQVPPTFLGTIMKVKFEGFEFPQPGIIQTEQKFAFHQPFSIGDIITYTCRIKDIYQLKGKLGYLTIILETQGYDPVGELVFTGNTTLVAVNRREENETPLAISDQRSTTCQGMVSK